MFLFLTEGKIRTKRHLDDLLLIWNKHDKSLSAEIGHNHLNSSLGPPLSGLRLGYLHFQP